MFSPLRSARTRNGPIARASAPVAASTSSASSGVQTSGEPCRLKLVFSTAPMPMRVAQAAQQVGERARRRRRPPSAGGRSRRRWSRRSSRARWAGATM